MAWIESHDDIWEHFKLLQLVATLGRPDYAVVGHLHALWHFTLRNAWRDADLSPWGDAGIERAAKWDGEAGLMVRSLREVGFLDGSTVHGWMERAGDMVRKRLDREKTRLQRLPGESRGDNGVPTGGQRGTTGPDHTETDHTSGEEQSEQFGPDDFVKLWNETVAPELPRVLKLTPERRRKIGARLRVNPERDYWARVIGAINASAFCRGQGPRGWLANLDFLLRPDAGTKILEGVYADRKATNGTPSQPVTAEKLRENTAALLALRRQQDEEVARQS